MVNRSLLCVCFCLIFYQSNLPGKSSYSGPKKWIQHGFLKNGIFPVRHDVPAVENVVVVKFKKEYPDKLFEFSLVSRFEKMGVRSVYHEFEMHRNDKTELSKIFRIRLREGSDIYEAIRFLNRDPSVVWAEPLYFDQINYEPNDPGISSQWYLTRIHAMEAWDIFRVEKGDREILIGVVDTGVNYEHPDLAANIWINPNENPNNGVDDDNNGYIDDWHGWDVADNDNNPYPSIISIKPGRWHGTMVSGVASSVTNNGIGIASPAFNAKILAVKATADDDETQRYLTNTHLGIVYTADMGANIINCSFEGSASNVGWEAVQHADSLGALVIAAAGNSDVDEPVYPANYPGVLSTAATNQSDQKASFSTGGSNYGYWIDVSAPGYNIFSTYSYAYESGNGTSFSSPLTASVAALVMGYHPNWTSRQVSEQIRISSDAIDELNPSYTHKLGYGRINAYRALTYSSPAVRISDVSQEEGAGSNQNGIIDPGEEAWITFTVTNYFLSIEQVSLVFTTDSPIAALSNGNFNGIALGELESWTNSGNPIRIQIDPDAERNQTIDVVLTIAGSNGYRDYDYIQVDVHYSYGTLEGANVQLTFTPDGNLGYADYSNNLEGVGFVFGPYRDQLFEGAVVAATDELHVSDVARGESGNSQNQDFISSLNDNLMVYKPGQLADEQGETIFNDESAADPIHLQVDQTVLAFYDTLYGDFMLIRYGLTNLFSETITNLRFGLFMDWDVGLDPYQDAEYNLAGFEHALNLGYIYKDDISLYCGLQVLNEDQTVLYRCVDNPTEIYDGYVDIEKWHHLSGGIQDTLGDTESDYSHILGVGPMHLGVGDTVLIGFAVLGGESLPDLKRNAALASEKWRSILTHTGIDQDREEQPASFKLYAAYPNPFNASTEISYHLLEKNHIILTIHDLQGREIIRLYNQQQDPGIHSVRWDGLTQGVQAASGIYFYRIVTEKYTETRKMILLR